MYFVSNILKIAIFVFLFAIEICGNIFSLGNTWDYKFTTKGDLGDGEHVYIKHIEVIGDTSDVSGRFVTLSVKDSGDLSFLNYSHYSADSMAIHIVKCIITKDTMVLNDTVYPSLYRGKSIFLNLLFKKAKFDSSSSGQINVSGDQCVFNKTWSSMFEGKVEQLFIETIGSLEMKSYYYSSHHPGYEIANLIKYNGKNISYVILNEKISSIRVFFLNNLISNSNVNTTIYTINGKRIDDQSSYSHSIKIFRNTQTGECFRRIIFK